VDEEKLLENVFRGLAGKKDKATFKDLLNWDFVLELVGEDRLSEAELRDMMVSAGGTAKSVTLGQFDKLMDALVLKHKESAEEEDGEEGEEGEELVEGEEGEYVDVDVEAVFEELCDGKAYFTMKDLRKWELLVRMEQEGIFSDSDLDEVVEAAGVDSKQRMDIMDLEAIITELQGGEEEE